MLISHMDDRGLQFLQDATAIECGMPQQQPHFNDLKGKGLNYYGNNTMLKLNNKKIGKN